MRPQSKTRAMCMWRLIFCTTILCAVFTFNVPGIGADEQEWSASQATASSRFVAVDTSRLMGSPLDWLGEEVVDALR